MHTVMYTMSFAGASSNERRGQVPTAPLKNSVVPVVIAAAVLASSMAPALGQQVKVGVQLPYTGVSAENSQQVDRGLELYLKLNAEKLKPYSIKLIKRDVKDSRGANARVAVQELLTQDDVDILTGWMYSPNAIATAPVVTAGKKPAVLMNAGTAHITNLSPYYVRVSFSIWHAGFSLGEAAARMLKAKTAVVGYTDYPPGKDSLAAFKRGFEANGGKVVDELAMGGANAVPDFTPFFQRAKEKKPDVFFVFVPGGDFTPPVVKTYHALGMRDVGIKLIGPGDITQDSKLQALGDAALGLVTMHHYNADLDNPENKQFVAAWKKEYVADAVPDFLSVGGYDGMAAIVHAIQATKGKVETGQVLAALKGWQHNSPRGSIAIDPATRDVVMNEYLSEVVRGQDGRLQQKVIGTIERVKDPCKELAVGPCAESKKGEGPSAR